MQLVREGALELRLGHQPRVPVLTIPQYIRNSRLARRSKDWRPS